jgi:hypothetical protein
MKMDRKKRMTIENRKMSMTLINQYLHATFFTVRLNYQETAGELLVLTLSHRKQIAEAVNFCARYIVCHHHHHQWRYSPESGLGLPYGFRDRMWIISPTINLVLVILIQLSETSSGEATIDI